VWVDDDGVHHTVAQGEGGEQRDALMPASFSVALKPAFSAIQTRPGPGELVVDYLDDIYLITAPENARRAYDITAEVLRQMCGIEVNQGKFVCWGRCGGAAHPGISALDTADRTVWRGVAGPVGGSGIVVVGVPVGDDEFVNSHGRALGHQHQEFLESLLRLPFVQHSWLLLLFLRCSTSESSASDRFPDAGHRICDGT
jgi:hypothetical protein